jgi:hypothetical protein
LWPIIEKKIEGAEKLFFRALFIALKKYPMILEFDKKNLACSKKN